MTTRAKFPERRKQRIADAAKRQAARDERTAEEQLERLALARGESRRETARLEARIEWGNEVAESL